ncbi:MFS transporter [Micromonospora narathiwatensis]|uniref:Major Facilitator Superfamily protein n=1 Tax=Micromonospora narathiwatensis TaxID=299146 RepID=A0A1A8Z873_9ACTN|nr:MFS transporter [Micromonospora narathiwatensis]SBT40036.1 Major Facilitator Superfamily protein [Micromonospora narathiwatensis]
MRQLLRRPDFRRFFLALTVSMIAESVLLLALAVWVKELTGSDGLAGATFVALTAPMVLAPLVGWVVDRAHRRTLFVALNAVTAALLLPLLAVHDDSRLWIIYAVAAGYGLSYIALGATVTALVQELVPAHLLPDANGASQTVKQGLRLAGPLLGAGLYVLLGGPALAGACALGFLLAGAIGLTLRTAPAPVEDDRAVVGGDPGTTPTGAATPRGTAAGATTGGRGALVAGLRHLVAEPALRRALVAVVVATVGLGFGETLWFAYVDQGLGRQPAFLGVLVSVQGIGGLVGGIGSAALVRRFGELGTLALGVAALAAGTLAMVRPGLVLAFVGIMLIGLGLPMSMVGTMTLMQRRTPPELVGRVSAALDALASGPQAVAIGAGALLVGLVDYRLLYAAIGVLLLVAAGYLLTGRRLTTPAAPAPATAPAEPAPAAAG